MQCNPSSCKATLQSSRSMHVHLYRRVPECSSTTCLALCCTVSICTPSVLPDSHVREDNVPCQVLAETLSCLCRHGSLEQRSCLFIPLDLRKFLPRIAPGCCCLGSHSKHPHTGQDYTHHAGLQLRDHTCNGVIMPAVAHNHTDYLIILELSSRKLGRWKLKTAP